jgi:MFS family permease
MMSSKKSVKEFVVGGSNAHIILVVLSLLWMINWMDRQVMSAVLEPMIVDLGLSDTAGGWLYTVFFLCASIFSFPVAYLLDRWSRRKAIALMAIVWSAATFLTGFGRNFITVLIPRAIVGVGEAGYSAGGTAMITAAYPAESRARAMGIFHIFVPLGAALGYILGGHISTHYGSWKAPFFIFAIPGIILGILALFLKDYKTVAEVDEVGKKPSLLESARAVLKVPTLRWLYIAHAMHHIMAISILVWLPAFLMRAHGITEKKAGLTVGIISLMAIIGSPLGGFLADMWQKRNRRGRMLVPVIGDLLAAAFLIPGLMLNVEGPGLYLMYVFGIMLMLGLPAVHTVTQDVVTPGLKGVSWGMTMLAIYILGGAWAPAAVGALSDHLGGGASGLKTALILSATAGFLSSLLFYFGSKTYPEDADKVKDIVLEAEELSISE